MNDIDVNTKSRSLALAPLPIVAYEFPCSYLGKPQPIESLLSSALLGTLLPPIGMISESSNSTNTTSVQPISHDEIEHDFVRFSCPRRTIDGISSQTILESENCVARLQYHNIQTLGSHSGSHNTMDTEYTTVATANSLTIEVWFTPILRGKATTEERAHPLLPIVSIAEPLASVGEIPKTTNIENSNEGQDPCERTQLMIGQRGEFLELVYRDHYEYLPEFDDDDDTFPPQYSCRILRINQWKLGEEIFENDEGDGSNAVKGLHHLVVAWKESGSVLEIFGNGKSIVSIELMPEQERVKINSDTDFIRHWDPSFRLQVFSESSRWLGMSDTTNKSTGDTALFSGDIHHVALYKQGLDEGTVKNLYEMGVEKRKDPFQTFFQDPHNPVEPLRLVASPSFSHFEEEESDSSTPIRGVKVMQGSSALISVGASQASNSTTVLWDVLIEILELPRYGDLIYCDDTKEPWEDGYNTTVQAGDRLLLREGSLRTDIEYRHLEDDYFSIPTHSYHRNILPMANLPGESFSYRLVAVKKNQRENFRDDSKQTNRFLGTSKAIQQELTIVHRNHPPILVGLPKEVVQPEWQPNGVGARPWATLGTSVFLHDELDHDIDRVRLDLWADEGTLTIDLQDTEIQSIAEITDCSAPSPTGLRGEWICNGKNDRNMTLLATPTDVSRILSNLKYKALNWDTSDSIVLQIHDGSGGLCPGEFGHNSNSCYSIVTSVNVPPMSRTEGGPSSGNIWIDHRSWWISLAVFLAILSATCCCAIGCWRRLRRIKKLNDISVSDLKRPSVILTSPDGSFPFDIGITEDDRMRAADDLKQRKQHQKDDSV